MEVEGEERVGEKREEQGEQENRKNCVLMCVFYEHVVGY